MCGNVGDMIRYTLKCSEGHGFDSWFASADAFDTLQGSGMVACPVCDCTSVEKSIMAPQVTSRRSNKEQAAPNPVAEPKGALSKPMSPAEAELSKLRKHVEDNSDYVGMSFAQEARKMHDGDTPHRAIYGEAKLEDAKKLLDDGVPVAPLPFMPQRKTN